LEDHVVGGDDGLDEVAVPGANVEARGGVGVGDLDALLAHVHGRDEARQRAVVVVPAAPRRNVGLVLGLAALGPAFLAGELLDGEVVESASLGGPARADYTLELAVLVRRTLLLDERVALRRVGSVG
jgi:hypothetical protein